MCGRSTCPRPREARAPGTGRHGSLRRRPPLRKRSSWAASAWSLNSGACGDVPDIARVFANGAIGREPADIDGVADGPRRPIVWSAPQAVERALGVPIGTEIGRHHEPVVLVKGIDDGLVTMDVIGRVDAG